jgi:leucine dehydrogenase
VFASIRSGLEHLDGTDLKGKRVVIQGVGHVGAALAHHLAGAGAEIVVADVNPVRAHDVARHVEGRVVDVELAPFVECDVFAPCATARVVSRDAVDQLRCRLIGGAANDILEHRDLAAELRRRGIGYIPDFLANAGGVICIHAGRVGWDEEQLTHAVLAIGDRVGAVMESAERLHITSLEVAEAMASVRLGHAIALPE